MGKGDKKSKKGKIFRGSFGKTRPSKQNKRKQQTITKQQPQQATQA